MKHISRGSRDPVSENSSYFHNWPDIVAPLIQAVNTNSFADALFDSINRIAPIDSALVMLFRVDQEPIVLFDRLHPSEQASFQSTYLGGAYLLSPLYRQFPSLPSGFYRLNALEQTDVALSDFGEAYFNDSGLSDDANFLHKIDNNTALVASFGRQQLCIPFSARELQILHIADPVYRSAMSKHWGQELLKNAETVNTDGKDHNTLSSSLQRFACSVLTEREQTVLGLMLDGKPSKLSARELQISVDTERAHRKNIYAKLNVSSQAQLFSLIFSTLSNVDLDGVTDPYVAYLALRPNK